MLITIELPKGYAVAVGVGVGISVGGIGIRVGKGVGFNGDAFKPQASSNGWITLERPTKLKVVTTGDALKGVKPKINLSWSSIE